jgi:hypothetical protein
MPSVAGHGASQVREGGECRRTVRARVRVARAGWRFIDGVTHSASQRPVTRFAPTCVGVLLRFPSNDCVRRNR